MALIYFIIYITGYISAYFLGRHNRRKNLGEKYDWSTVRFLLCFCIFSWASFVIIGTDPSTYSFDGKLKIKTKPPKWL